MMARQLLKAVLAGLLMAAVASAVPGQERTARGETAQDSIYQNDTFDWFKPIPGDPRCPQERKANGAPAWAWAPMLNHCITNMDDVKNIPPGEAVMTGIDVRDPKYWDQDGADWCQVPLSVQDKYDWPELERAEKTGGVFSIRIGTLPEKERPLWYRTACRPDKKTKWQQPVYDLEFGNCHPYRCRPWVDARPFIEKGRVFVPLRLLAEQGFGLRVSWDPRKRTATITGQMISESAERTVVVTVGSKTALVNGKPLQMDVAPKVVKPGRIMVPIRFIAEAFGAGVMFQETMRRVEIGI